MKSISVDVLETGNENILKSRVELSNAVEAEILASEALADAQMHLILGGEVLGKNEKEREAWLRNATAPAREALLAAQRRKRFGQLALEIALDNRRLCENILRVEE